MGILAEAASSQASREVAIASVERKKSSCRRKVLLRLTGLMTYHAVRTYECYFLGSVELIRTLAEQYFIPAIELPEC